MYTHKLYLALLSSNLTIKVLKVQQQCSLAYSIHIFHHSASFAQRIMRIAWLSSIPQLCQCPLLCLYKFCNSKACVIMMAEYSSMKVTSALGAAHKSFPKAHGTRFSVIPFAFPAHSTSAAAQSAPAHLSACSLQHALWRMQTQVTCFKCCSKLLAKL